MYAGIYVYSKNSKAIVTLGIPLSLVVFVGIIHWIKAMGDKADVLSKRALDARRGAVAEEAVGNLLGELPAGYFVVNDFVLRRGTSTISSSPRKGSSPSRRKATGESSAVKGRR